MFLHGGWVHLLGNMLFLLIFGNDMVRSMDVLPNPGSLPASVQVKGVPSACNERRGRTGFRAFAVAHTDRRRPGG